MASDSLEAMPIHFFKIILTETLHQGKLMMPIKFVEKYGEGLPNASIYLKTPNGANWKLSLVKSDGKIWFEKGWKEFAKYHSLARGHLIVFKYERNSHFEVQIFDKSAFEIKYPFKRLDDIASVSNGQKRKVNSALGNTSCVNDGKLQKLSTLHHVDKKFKDKDLVIAKKDTPLHRAISFRTCNPSFYVVMRPSYIHHAYSNLHIPSEFGRGHLLYLEEKKGDIHLRLSNGRVWPGKYLIRKDNAKAKKIEICSSGWKQFVKDNNLKVGDVCTFELFPSSTILTFIVHNHIFKGSFET